MKPLHPALFGLLSLFVGAPLPSTAAVLFDSIDYTQGADAWRKSDPDTSGPFSQAAEAAARFTLPTNATITNLSWLGINFTAPDVGRPLLDDTFTIFLYNDVGGAPAEIAFTSQVLPAVGRSVFDLPANSINRYLYVSTLSVPLNLSAGDYWFSLVNNTSASNLYDWFWLNHSERVDASIHQLAVREGTVGSGAWATDGSRDFDFRLEGTFVPEPSIPALLCLAGFGLTSRRRYSPCTIGFHAPATQLFSEGNGTRRSRTCPRD